MIKRTLLITIFIFALISLFTSCEKKTELLEKKVDVTEQKILNFKGKINSTNKSNETLSIDSAVWYIEAALNYTHCKNTLEKQQSNLNAIYVDSVIADIELINNSITMVETINTFFKFEGIITSTFNNFNYDVKFYDIVDIKYIGNKIIAYYAFAYNSACSEKTNCYALDQDWYWGEDLGKCDGTCVGKDATDILYQHVNYNVAYPANQYFTDINYFIYSPHELDATGTHFILADDNNPNGDFLLFFINTPSSQTTFCMSDKFMKYHVSGTRKTLNMMQAAIPTGYKFKSWDLVWFAGSYHYGYGFGHSCKVWYGIGHNISPSN